MQCPAILLFPPVCLALQFLWHLWADHESCMAGKVYATTQLHENGTILDRDPDEPFGIELAPVSPIGL